MLEQRNPSGTETVAAHRPTNPPSNGLDLATVDHEAALAEVLAGLFDPEVVAEMAVPAVGRFEVLGHIGSGGMGSVYEARDPELDRRVAIKVLHADAGDPGKLVEEGKAMARLNHPNVVTVYEVGRADDRVFVVMELVEGDTLRRWQRARDRSWREVVEMYQSFGAGIAAAHAGGLVHCDLKPENVVVGDDGRAKVTDFGIARMHRVDLVTVGERGTRPPVRDTSTRMAGTPRYMSPEQYGPDGVDHRADQFGYCVMLWEALYRVPPFSGRTVAELAAQVTLGEIETPPVGVAVPPWLRRIVERGLSPNRAERWPDMPALLDALARGRGRARTRRAGWIAAGVGALLVIGYGAHEMRQAQVAERCEAEGAAIEEIWGPARVAEVRARLVEVGGESAETTADRVKRWLDESASDWRDVATQACLTRELTPPRDAEVSVRTAWCLADRRAELEMIIEPLRDPTRSVFDNAVTLVAHPLDMEGCTDQTALARLALPPVEQRDRVREIHRRRLRAQAANAAGDRPEAERIAKAALGDAQALGWAPLEAVVRSTVAATLLQSGRTDEARSTAAEAYFSAMTLGDLQTAKSSAEQMLYIEGDLRGDLEVAQTWGRHVDVLLDKLDQRGTPAEIQKLVRLAEALRLKGRRDEAQPLIDAALEIVTRTLGTEHPRYAFVLGALSTNLRERGRTDEALAHNLREVEICEAVYGHSHPRTATALLGLGATYSQAARYAEASVALRRAHAIFVRAVGPDGGRVAMVLVNLAGAEQAQGNEDEAIALLRQALAISEKVLGPRHVRVGIALNNLGNALKSAGKNEPARHAFLRALDIFETELESDYPHVAFVANNLGELEIALGDFDAAVGYLKRSLEIRERELGSDHVRLLAPLVLLGEQRLRLEDFEGAQVFGERAAKIAARGEGSAIYRSRSELLLASVSWPDDPARARAIAEGVRAEMLRLGADGEPGADSAVRWLEAHPARAGQPMRSARER